MTGLGLLKVRFSSNVPLCSMTDDPLPAVAYAVENTGNVCGVGWLIFILLLLVVTEKLAEIPPTVRVALLAVMGRDDVVRRSFTNAPMETVAGVLLQLLHVLPPFREIA